MGLSFSLVKDNTNTHAISKVTYSEGPETLLKGSLKNGKEFQVSIPQNDKDMLALVRENVSDFSVVQAETFWTQFFFLLLCRSFYLFSSFGLWGGEVQT
jgi:hypothetical protein